MQLFLIKVAVLIYFNRVGSCMKRSSFIQVFSDLFERFPLLFFIGLF